MITYDILFSDGRVSYGVASHIAAAARRAQRIAQHGVVFGLDFHGYSILSVRLMAGGASGIADANNTS